MAGEGQILSSSGQKEPYLGHHEEVTPCPQGRKCQVDDSSNAYSGQARTIESAQTEHKISTKLDELPQDLQMVVAAWEKLPEDAKKSIVAIVKSFYG